MRDFAKLGALSAVADVVPSRAEDAAESLRSRSECTSTIPIRSWEEILQDASVTAVALATPATQHAEMALAALGAGKHVFIEKPLALTVTDGKLIEDAARKAGRTAMVGHSYRYHPAFQKLKSLVERGVLGRIMHIHSRRLGFGRIRHEENVFWSLAPHDISMILALVGGEQPSLVHARGQRVLQRHRAVTDIASADLVFSKGVHAHIQVSWLYPEKERKVIVVGERGTAVFDDTEQLQTKLRIYNHEINWESGQPELVKGGVDKITLQDDEPVYNECCHFLECVDTGTAPLTDVSEGISVISVLQLIDNAMELDHSALGEGIAGPMLAPMNEAADMVHNSTPATSSTSMAATSQYEKLFAQSKANSKFPSPQNLKVTLIDLASQKYRIQQNLGLRLAQVFDHMKFIMGPEVEELEKRVSAFSGALYTISCASGTDALTLALLAMQIRRGDAVLVPALTFAASVEPIVLLGAVPIIVDVDPETLTIDPDQVSAGVSAAHKAGLRPVGVIAVDLYGHPADYQGLRAVLNALGKRMWVIGDAAQSFGASLHGSRVGTMAHITTTSFFPSKPLGCYGDGGAIMTDDPEIATTLRSLQLHGRSKKEKFDHLLVGVNSRLDTIQAAVLLCKLDIFTDEMALRQRVAAYYTDSLLKKVTNRTGKASILPATLPKKGVHSAWAAYTVRVTAIDRPLVQEQLSASGIESIVYYPKPIHEQAAYAKFPVATGSCPVAEHACREVLSIPMHPYLKPSTQDLIIAALARITTF